MTPVEGLIATWAISGTLGLILFVLRAGWIVERVPDLPALGASDGASWPSVSVIVTACNEESTVVAALETLVRADYPGLEIVVVNDRSTDATGHLVDEVAAAHERVRAVHIAELPAGWLGKVHAMGEGMKAARGDWLLFTDADVHFAPQAIRRAVQTAERQGLDHLSLLPDLLADGLWTKVAIFAFGIMFMTKASPHLAGVAGSGCYVGVGAFNMVRRKALEASRGFSWMRMEVADDLALAAAIYDGGGKSRFMLANDALALTWYAKLGDMFRGLEKNMFGAGCHYSWRRAALLVFAAIFALVAPVAALLVTAVPGVWTLPLLLLVVLAARATPFARRLGQPAAPMLLLPLGLLILTVAVLRSAVICSRQGGIVWRGTHYGLAELRAGQVVRL